MLLTISGMKEVTISSEAAQARLQRPQGGDSLALLYDANMEYGTVFVKQTTDMRRK